MVALPDAGIPAYFRIGVSGRTLARYKLANQVSYILSEQLGYPMAHELLNEAIIFNNINSVSSGLVCAWFFENVNGG
jgi:uncharacterized protein with ParB-like and HNH nuclease domain